MWKVGRQMRNPCHIAERCDGFSAALRPGDADRAGTQSVRRDVPPPSGVTRGGLRLRREDNSLVEHELLRVHQRPEDVLVGGLLVRWSGSWRLLLDVGQGGFAVLSVGLRPKTQRNSSVTFSASGRVSLAFASWSARPPARLILSCTSSLVEQVQRRGQVRLVDAFALAGADALRPAEHVEEVRLRTTRPAA